MHGERAVSGRAKTCVFAFAAFVLARFAGAAEITENQAVQAVRGWMDLELMLQDKFSAEPESVRRCEGKDGKGAFYVVSLKGGGVVVTSGDTALSPVVAYSKDGEWTDDPAKNPVLAMLQTDVAAATAAATAAGGGTRASAGAAAATAANKNATRWAALLAAGNKSSSGRASAGAASLKYTEPADLRVPKLLETKWNQADGKWNLYTPKQRVCGCVATASGQIMAYFRWPKGTVTPGKVYENASGVIGIGGWHMTKGYQATKEQAEAGEYTPWGPNGKTFGEAYDWDKINPGAAEGDASEMSRLVRDIGVATYMSYGSGGGETITSRARDAFLETFQYANAKLTGWEAENVWKATILSNLDAKRPVMVEVPGHEIVADGYGYQDGNLYVHFNMGWSGTYNYWYQPPDLTETNQSGFTSIGCLVYNIYPSKIYENETADLTIVSGRLLGKDGTALAERTVHAERNGAVYTATTDEKGIYALYLPGGDNHVYTIYAEGEDGATAVAPAVAVKECAGDTHANIHGLELKIDREQTPAISPADGSTFYGARRTVALSCATPGATIHYTTDGSEPTQSSPAYAEPFFIHYTTTVKARIWADGYWNGPAAAYTITKAEYYGDLHENTPENRALWWIDESEATREATGAWKDYVDYANGAMNLAEPNSFTPSVPNGGKTVTIEHELSFDNYWLDGDGLPDPEAKTAFRLGRNGSIQLLTGDGAGGFEWTDVSAGGLTPAIGAKYNIAVEMDLESDTFKAYISAEGGEKLPLKDGNGAVRFRFACASSGTIREIDYTGKGKLHSIRGFWKYRRGLFFNVR